MAGIDTGDIAPMSRNGVITTAWLARLYSTIADSIRSSQRSGELQLISEIDTGARRRNHRLPDLLGIVLDEARSGIDLAELLLRARNRDKRAVEQDGARRRGTLIDREEVVGHGASALLAASARQDRAPGEWWVNNMDL